MIPGVRGRLLTASYVRDVLPGIAADKPPDAFRRTLDVWWERAEQALGPASSVRSIVETAIVPLLTALDLEVTGRVEEEGRFLLQTRCAGRAGPPVLVAAWNQPLSPLWRAAILRAVAHDTRWSFCTNGTTLRLVDSRRAWSREYLELDLPVAAQQPELLWLLWTFARGPAITDPRALLDHAVEQSARHGLDVCRALGHGVLDALSALFESFSTSVSRSSGRISPQRHPGRERGRDDGDDRALLELSITVLYRVLFLLFAEARGLVPLWHPVYRDRYSLESIVTALLDGRPCRGLWHAVQAISRLAYSGCRAGALKVNAFNGRLFSPAETSMLERISVGDPVMARAIIAIGSRPVRQKPQTSSGAREDRNARRRILYRDLDVEQLGAVYEQVLEYEPRSDAAGLTRTRDIRKASASFYTPRAVTAFLVRQTLAPLVDGKNADQILALRVLDPAMGSGAFLVAACRYLAAAAEDALIREGRWHPGDIVPEDRVLLRREIAARCLFGVDVNPMAVQLARLSLWLATLAHDKPLSFLDHHLVVGDSLVGAFPGDVRRQPSRATQRRARSDRLPLFDDEELTPALEDAVRVRLSIACTPDDSAEAVRQKERTLASLHPETSVVARWSRLLDLWCAGWFWPTASPPDRAAFLDLSATLLDGAGTLPSSQSAPILATADAVAAERRFLHWPLVFPEVFTSESGGASSHPGFDAVIGNPPWDMLRGDSGSGEVRHVRRHLAAQLTGFARESGVYRAVGRVHVNRYQLFLERGMQLVRAGGRIGLVLPSGVLSDAGSATLRRQLFDRADVDSIVGLDNHAGIFPIHRSVRFALLTCTHGTPTTTFSCRFGLSRGEDLDELRDPARQPLTLTRRLLARISGEEDLGIPGLASDLDLRIVDRITATVPRLGSEHGWNVRFSRELNASDDRGSFGPSTGNPDALVVVEGKQIDSFRVALERCRFELRTDARTASRVSGAPRVAYRDVASATNRLTLISAIVPARAVTTHTLFCLKSPLDTQSQHVLCALLNSFIANYLVRLRVQTHVTVALVSNLPLPHVSAGDAWFARLASLSEAIAGARTPFEDMREYAELQAIAAQLYGVTAEEFEHVLGTFPLIKRNVRAQCLSHFRDIPSDTNHRDTETQRP